MPLGGAFSVTAGGGFITLGGGERFTKGGGCTPKRLRSGRERGTSRLNRVVVGRDGGGDGFRFIPA